MNKEVLQKLPKTELHCHLDGSLSLEVIRELANLAGKSLPNENAELEALVIAPAKTSSLLDYLETFEFIRPLLQTKEALRLAAYDVARQAALENVLYQEIRFAPELSMDEGLSVSDTIHAVLDGLDEAREEFGIVCKVLICGLRQSSEELTLAIFEKAIEWAKRGVVGFDFAGDEHNYPPQKIKAMVEKATSLGLPLTFHAGECGCPQNISDAIDLGAKRLGHVTAIYNQEDLLEKFVEKGIVAELCLTSNLQTKAANSIEEFPYRALYQKGANITISTDNRTVSNTTLTKEYELYMNYFDTTYADFLTFNRYAILGSFTTEEEKFHLIQKLEKKYQPFLNQG